MFHEGVFFLIMKKVEMEVFMEEEKKKEREQMILSFVEDKDCQTIKII